MLEAESFRQFRAVNAVKDSFTGGSICRISRGTSDCLVEDCLRCMQEVRDIITLISHRIHLRSLSSEEHHEFGILNAHSRLVKTIGGVGSRLQFFPPTDPQSAKTANDSRPLSHRGLSHLEHSGGVGKTGKCRTQPVLSLREPDRLRAALRSSAPQGRRPARAPAAVLSI